MLAIDLKVCESILNRRKWGRYLYLKTLYDTWLLGGLKLNRNFLTQPCFIPSAVELKAPLRVKVRK